MTEAYPLAWPAGRPRTPPRDRLPARFTSTSRTYSGDGMTAFDRKKPITVNDASKRLYTEVERMQNSLGARLWRAVISTNIETRADGQPRSDRREPDDPGVAVYFRAGEKDYCFPCDKWNTVGGNIAAIAGHIEAIRRIERYGVQSLHEAFSGFVALPEPGNRPWRQVLELHRADRVTAADVEAAFRTLARQRHPDHGGSHEMMAELNAAVEQARREVGGG